MRAIAAVMTGSMPGSEALISASLDIMRLFEQAHWIVKSVMALLAVMFVVGLYVIIYMVTTEDKIASWAFPTGAIAAWMMAGGGWWFVRKGAAKPAVGP